MSIVIENLNKSYQNTKILEDLNLKVNSSTIFGLLGPNGAGKTTLLSILNNLTKKDSGNIKIYDYDLDSDEKNIKSISSYIPQTYAFYPNLTAYENLEFFGALYGLKSKNLQDKIFDVIQSCSLEKYIHKKAFTFSGGVKRRLNIAIGLLNSPKILYLDEPTVGIDPHSRKYILDIIKKINITKGLTIFYTSHYMDEIEYLCDEIAILDNKKIIIQDSIKNLKANNSYEKLDELFFDITKESLRD
ncbi:ABC transporter ATP-binding protein [Arcobacter lacus]|jgi:ABC-2 type transport system ATP-binding protein|uniref:ABC transporter n=1 Tax=Arcobacter lacus TaxID=1912876 RepID=A0ABX5JID3_9BACT|nr:ABC transporter ATP-binding protein [Arcobacter lacus]MCT7909474.1 ABC transporter ATP-binding protein [Arcobacter lacus]MCT7911967.1 ABC transporter ATP-binding protein [Arcobacter lacus]PUE67124.1 ABC transporter [Arcobacter lacus]